MHVYIGMTMMIMDFPGPSQESEQGMNFDVLEGFEEYNMNGMANLMAPDSWHPGAIIIFQPTRSDIKWLDRRKHTDSGYGLQPLLS